MNRAKFLKLAGAAPLIAVIPSSAFAEGSGPLKPVLPNLPPKQLDLYNNPNVYHIGFKQAIHGYEHVYPTLAEAVKEMSTAVSTKIEWLDRRGKVHWNWTQIIRTPYGASGTEMARYGHASVLNKLRLEALHRHLADVENVLLLGQRKPAKFSEHSLFRMTGGLKQLGPGKPVLRTLRDLTLLTNRQAMDEDSYQEEFLSEFSLQVKR